MRYKYHIMKILNSGIILFLLASLTLSARAQKLPTVQNASVLLPAFFKIDGNAKEWNNTFQAYNKNTNIYSTLANDAQSLYVIVQARESIIIKKIIGGGITFTICTSGSRADANPFAVTFPVIAPSFQASIFSTINELKDQRDAQKIDSLVRTANAKITKEGKLIGVKGFREIADSFISPYNRSGIRTVTNLGSDGLLTCEFLVPLKLLGIQVTEARKLAYNIMLNSPTVMQSNKVKKGKLTAVAISIPRSLSNNQNDANVIQYPTDYWGQYVLRN